MMLHLYQAIGEDGRQDYVAADTPEQAEGYWRYLETGSDLASLEQLPDSEDLCLGWAEDASLPQEWKTAAEWAAGFPAPALAGTTDW